MKFCSECGGKVAYRTRDRDRPPHFQCSACQAIFYQDPRLAVACLIDLDQQVLLCRRAADPGQGLWTFPSGFVERGERASAAAIRETMEEAGVEVEILRPYAMFNIPAHHQVHIVFLARPIQTTFAAGPEISAVQPFAEADLPWADLAFSTTRETLRAYFRDRAEGYLGFHYADIVSVFDES